jgi:hypothetical protein
MASKLRIKMGPVEVEYEGEENFLKEEFPQLLSAISSLYKQSNFEIDSKSGAAANDNAPPSGAGKALIKATTSTIASKLGVKTGSDLIIAAAANLTLVQQKDSFTRQEISDQMKSATAFHNKNYISNLSSLLTTLVKNGVLNEIANNTYALNAQKRSEIEALIA